MSGHRVPPNSATHFYSATKYTVTALTEGLRQELREAQTHIRATVRLWPSLGGDGVGRGPPVTRCPEAHGQGGCLESVGVDWVQNPWALLLLAWPYSGLEVPHFTSDQI